MKELAKPTVGDSDLGQWLNRIRENIGERTPRAGDGIRIDYFPDHFKIHSTAKGGGGGFAGEQMLVTTTKKNHLECRRVTVSDDGVRTATSEIIRVAKPDELRSIGWDSNDRSIAGLSTTIAGYQYDYTPDTAPWNQRTTTLVDGEEFDAEEVVFSEQVSPDYIENHTVILAARVKPSPLFTVTEDEGTPEEATYNIEWIDMNLAGRVWLPEYRKTRVCVSGQTGTWYVLIRASNAFQEG
jgi:hypothetical protein